MEMPEPWRRIVCRLLARKLIDEFYSDQRLRILENGVYLRMSDRDIMGHAPLARFPRRLVCTCHPDGRDPQR